MSFFSKIASAEHTFAAFVERELTAIRGAAPAIEHVADAILKYAGPALQVVVTAEAGQTAGAEVGKVISQAQSDLTVASALVYDFGATPSAASIVSSVQNNLTGLLTAGHITNASSVSNTNKVINSLGALVTAIGTPTA